MCKQPARYYCPKCGTYTTDPGDSGHEDQHGPICPTCHGPVAAVDPKASSHPFYCPQCQISVDGLDAIPPDGAKPLSCSICGTELVKPSDSAPNPVSFPIALEVLGLVARLLLVSGAIANLEEYARKSSNRADDLAAHLTVGLLKECAKL